MTRPAGSMRSARRGGPPGLVGPLGPLGPLGALGALGARRWLRAAMRAVVIVGVMAAGGAGCSGARVGLTPGGGGTPSVIQAGAPGQPSRPAGRTPPPVRTAHTDADVRFMQGMIAHHMQAMEMTAMVEGRAARDDIRSLARRIEATQADELGYMERWLTARGEPTTMPSHDGTHAHVPGMLMPEELARLKRSSGTAFDRLFIESMIRHHEGAVSMVETLFATDGAGQEAEIFQFAQHVDADQRNEIARMRRLQTEQARGE